MSAPTLDVARFAKVRALHASSAHAGERQAAARTMGKIAQAAGLTIPQAIAQADRQSAATLARRQAEEAFLDDLFGAP